MAAQVAILTLDLTIAAAATDERYLSVPLPGTWEIKAIKFAPATAVAIDATNYLTSTITSNDGAGGADVAVSSHTTLTGGDALALKTTVDLTLTAGSGLEVVEGGQIKIAKTEGGTGGALDGCYSIYLEKARV